MFTKIFIGKLSTSIQSLFFLKLKALSSIAANMGTAFLIISVVNVLTGLLNIALLGHSTFINKPFKILHFLKRFDYADTIIEYNLLRERCKVYALYANNLHYYSVLNTIFQ